MVSLLNSGSRQLALLMALGPSEGLPSQTVLGTPQSRALLADLFYVWPYQQGAPQVAMLMSEGHNLFVAVASASVYRDFALRIDESSMHPRLVRYRHQGTFTVDRTRLTSDFAKFVCEVNGDTCFWSIVWLDLLGPGSLGHPVSHLRTLPRCSPFEYPSQGSSFSLFTSRTQSSPGWSEPQKLVTRNWLSVFQPVDLDEALEFPAIVKRRTDWLSDDVFGDIATGPASKRLCLRTIHDPDYSIVMDTPEAIASSSSSLGDSVCVHQ